MNEVILRRSALTPAARTARTHLAPILGIAALATSVAAAVWLAAGVAAGPRWLELPTRSDPSWVFGPLHGLWSLSTGALGVGLIVLAASYLVALACARSISLRLALGAVALANLAFTLGPTIVSSDVFGYIAYARELARHGLNPYLYAPSSLGHDPVLSLVYWVHEPSPYGPAFTLLSAPLGLLSPAVAMWTFKALAGLAGVGLATLVGRIARRRAIDPARAAIFVGLNPVLLFYAVSGAHNDLLAALLTTSALALVGGERAGAGLAVAAAAVKATLGLALPFVLIGARRRRRAAGSAALAIAVIAIGAVLLFGTHLFSQLHRITTEARFDIAWSGPDLLARALSAHITPTIRLACIGASLLAAVAALARAWRGADPIACAGWAFLALLASIASLAPWYLVWLLPLAALGRSRALWWVALLATGYMLAVHLPALGGEPWLTSA